MATDDVVTTIIESLKESEELPRKQIAEIVEILGSDVASALLAETRRVQDEGGIEVRDGTRRRTDGGVFFSLARSKLSKADRNRIFRVRPPKVESATPPAESADGASPENVDRPSPERRVRGDAMPSAPRDGVPLAPGLGRRRVVEVEVIRQRPLPAPAPAPIAEPRAVALARDVAPREQSPSQPELRPLRRIVTVAPVTRDEAPATPDAARERVRAVLRSLPVADQRRVVADVLRELGGTPKEPKRAPEPEPSPAGGSPVSPGGLDGPTRESVLASVTDALGLSSGDLALALYGEETPGARAKARGALDRWRKK